MNTIPEPLATPDEVAEFLRVATDTLTTWRHRDRGPAFVRLGKTRGTIRYRWEDVFAWVADGAPTEPTDPNNGEHDAAAA